MTSSTELKAIIFRQHHGQARSFPRAWTDLDHNAVESLNPKNGKSTAPVSSGGMGGIDYEARTRGHLATRIKVSSGDSRTHLVASLLPGLLLSTHRGQLARLGHWILRACKFRCTTQNLFSTLRWVGKDILQLFTEVTSLCELCMRRREHIPPIQGMET
jgi:hypothetical protein